MLEGARLRRQGDVSLRVMAALIKPGDTVIDVGANVGVYAFALARLVGRSGHVHAIEPDPVSVARLRRIAARCGQIEVHPVAASDARGSATLHVPVYGAKRLGALASLGTPGAGGAVQYESVSIDADTLDEIVPMSEPAFIKIDVEGHEMAALRGAERTIRRTSPALLVEIEQRHSAVGVTATFDHILARG